LFARFVRSGIHNEPGLETVPLTTTKDLLVKMINLATDTTDKDRSFVPFQNDGKDEIVLMVNNLGGSFSFHSIPPCVCDLISVIFTSAGISELELGGIVVSLSPLFFLLSQLSPSTRS